MIGPLLFSLQLRQPMQPYYNQLSPAALSERHLDELLALGWYRMHQDVFTTSHIKREEWQRVHWLRFAVADCRLRSSHRRMLKKAERFTITIEDGASIPDEHEALYARYYESIDFDGARSVADSLFGEEPPGLSIFQTKAVCVSVGSRLIAVGYFDIGHEAAASILHFYDPAYARYSPGKLLILKTLEYLRHHHYTYYYPGYVVENDRKMNYKLFLGADLARYFDPETTHWKPLPQLPDFNLHFA